MTDSPESGVRSFAMTGTVPVFTVKIRAASGGFLALRCHIFGFVPPLTHTQVSQGKALPTEVFCYGVAIFACDVHRWAREIEPEKL